MNASSSPSATMTAKMAFSTTAAGPSLHNFSKMDSIAEPEGCVRSVLRALLVRPEARHVLSRIDLEPQSTTVGSRGKPPDLIHLCEVFRAGRKEHVSGEPFRAPTRQWESQARDSGRAPFGACPREGAPRTRRSHRERPLSGQIDD